MANGRKPDAVPDDPVDFYVRTADLADEASLRGHAVLARELEAALAAFLSSLQPDEQGEALRRAYESALRGRDPAPPRLRLAFSRD